MSSTPKSTKSLVQELFQAVSKLSSAVSSGVIGTPINPGPVVEPRRGTAPRPRRK